jgi:putative acetyltransferase
MTVTIRAEHPDDHEAIARVVTRAFGSPAEASLVEAIRASPEYVPELALVALDGDRVVGHVMISGAVLVDGDGRRPIAMLSPLAVEPSRQRRGVGAALVRAVTELAADRGEPVVILEGDPAYYGRFGFEHATPLGIDIHLPSWAPPEAAQVLRLPSYEPSMRGQVVYPPAFDQFAGG